jgi:hypothetical protein
MGRGGGYRDGEIGKKLVHAGWNFGIIRLTMVHVEHVDVDERDLKPERFALSDRTVSVKEVLDRWFGNTYTYFKVLGDDDHTYILKHSRLENTWDVVFTETDAPSGPAPSWPYTRPASSHPS